MQTNIHINTDTLSKISAKTVKIQNIITFANSTRSYIFCSIQCSEYFA